MMMDNCNPSIWEVEAEELWVWGQSGLLSKTLSQKEIAVTTQNLETSLMLPMYLTVHSQNFSDNLSHVCCVQPYPTPNTYHLVTPWALLGMTLPQCSSIPGHSILLWPFRFFTELLGASSSFPPCGPECSLLIPHKTSPFNSPWDLGIAQGSVLCPSSSSLSLHRAPGPACSCHILMTLSLVPEGSTVLHMPGRDRGSQWWARWLHSHSLCWLPSCWLYWLQVTPGAHPDLKQLKAPEASHRGLMPLTQLGFPLGISFQEPFLLQDPTKEERKCSQGSCFLLIESNFIVFHRNTYTF
jgi:hypothetical protein